MKKVYVLLSRTGTLPARVIRFFKGGRYSHTSLSLTPETCNFYSYARRRLHNPLIAGFIIEDIHTKVFAKYPDAPCVLYSITISSEAYDEMCKRIEDFKKNYKKAKYSFIGFIALAFGIKFESEYRLTCSQFVALMLHRTGEIKLPKDPYLMLPNDFMEIEGIEKVYEGILTDCTIPEETLA